MDGKLFGMGEELLSDETYGNDPPLDGMDEHLKLHRAAAATVAAEAAAAAAEEEGRRKKKKKGEEYVSLSRMKELEV